MASLSVRCKPSLALMKALVAARACLFDSVERMLGAMAELWRLSPPGPDNILAHPAFVRLREACRDNYPGTGKTGPAFALSTALRGLGLPRHVRTRGMAGC